MSQNTHPNTPFGKFFEKIGVWHPKIIDGIEDLYNKLHDVEKVEVTKASSWIAILNDNVGKTPEDIFKLIQVKFPDVTREYVTEKLNKLNAQILKVDASIPESFEDALTKLQDYLGKFQGNTWISMTRATVSVLADVLLNGQSPVQTIETVLEMVYQTFVKDKIPTTAKA
jgi:hypothetical protein